MRIIVTPEAQKQYVRIPKTEQLKIQKKLLILQEDYKIGKRLTGEFAGLYSVKAWPYRIVYGFKKEKKEIWVLSIKHRQGVYK